jgi:hypothetical protein
LPVAGKVLQTPELERPLPHMRAVAAARVREDATHVGPSRGRTFRQCHVMARIFGIVSQIFGRHN